MKIISKAIHELKYLLWLKAVRDALWNFWAYFVIILVWIITSSILAKNLSPDEYWMLWLVVTIIWMIAWFIWFWFFEWYSLVLLKEENPKKQKELIWTWIIILIWLSIIFFITTLIALPVINLIYGNISITKAIFIINFISCFSLINIFIINTTKYLWKMKWQAFYSLLQPILYLSWLFLLLHFKILSFQYALVVTYTAFLISGILMLIYLKPKFSNIKENFWKIREKQKTEGLNLYLNLVNKWIAIKIDNIILWYYSFSNIAYYTLWNVLISPLLIFSNQLSSALIKNFNKTNTINKKIIIYNISLWFLYSVFILITYKYIILFLWTEDYLIISSFIYLLLIHAFISILTTILYDFLHIKKNITIFLKKISYYRLWTNLIFSLLLIPIFWISWAILSIIMSKTIMLIMYTNLYKKYVSKNI